MKKIALKTVGFIALDQNNERVINKDGSTPLYKKASSAKGRATTKNQQLDERKVQQLENRLNAWASKFSS